MQSVTGELQTSGNHHSILDRPTRDRLLLVLRLAGVHVSRDDRSNGSEKTVMDPMREGAKKLVQLFKEDKYRQFRKRDHEVSDEVLED